MRVVLLPFEVHNMDEVKRLLAAETNPVRRQNIIADHIGPLIIGKSAAEARLMFDALIAYANEVHR